jgi:ferredoxin-type protein NapH
MKSQNNFNLARLKVPLILLAIFWAIAILLWQTTGRIFYLFNFGFIGLALCLGLGVYTALPKRQKPWGRRLAQFLIGTYMLVFLGFIQRENMQIEGFFFYILAGFFAGSVIHYLVAKILGPLVFNRGWCGWACWTAMVLDLLPYKQHKRERLPRKWDNFRYFYFVFSLGLVIFLWYGYNYRILEQSLPELYWLVVGNVLYYVIGIGLAFALQDNRAFCKYICPITVPLKFFSQFSLLKVSGHADKCNDCGACNKMCPMDIQISKYILNNQRVLSTECIFCLECINVCAKGALDTSFGTKSLMKVEK